MIKFKKITLIIMFLLIFVSCKKANTETEDVDVTINVEKPKEKETEYNITSMTFGGDLLIDNIEKSDEYKINTDKVNNYSSIEQGKFDIGIIPAYLGPYFNNKTNQAFEIAAITQTGELYMLSDTEIRGQEDLKGKNVFLPDPIGNISKVIDKKIGLFNLFLRLKIEYYQDTNDVVKKSNSSDNFVSLLVEPYYSKAKKNNLYKTNLNTFLPIGKGDFLRDIIIVKKDYLVNNKEKFDKFLDLCKKSIEKINQDPEISDNLCEKYKMSKEELNNAIDNMGFSYIDKDTMKGTYQIFLERLKQIDESLLGEIKPSDSLYYIDK